MSTPDTIPADICYRCGYDLRATPDDRPCPECGLLAQRSRRPSDELRHTRPKWLWSLAWGAILILGSMLGSWAWLIASTAIYSAIGRIVPTAIYSAIGYVRQLHLYTILLEMSGLVITAVLLLVGVWLLTLPEKYPPADAADRTLRRWLRIAAAAPLLAVSFEVAYALVQHSIPWPAMVSTPNHPVYLTLHRPIEAFQSAAFYVATIGSAPLPLLLFLRLRGLAKRARSAHLAEHCLIVGIGAAASLVYAGAIADVFENPQRYGLDSNWANSGSVSLALTLMLTLAAILMVLWTIYLLVRFTISFIAAARHVQH